MGVRTEPHAEECFLQKMLRPRKETFASDAAVQAGTGRTSSFGAWFHFLAALSYLHSLRERKKGGAPTI